MSGYVFEKHANYCNLRFTEELAGMAWPDIEAAASQATKLVHDSAMNAVLADLSAIKAMPEGFVALLLRIWRDLDEGSRKLVVVAPQAKVKAELKLAGLSSLWTVVDSVPDGLQKLGVNKDKQPVAASLAATGSQKTATDAGAAEEPLAFAEQRGYCSVQFNPVLMTMNWADVEAKTTQVLTQLKQSKTNSVMVDLGRMQYINSGLVASLVRIWKTMQERKGQFSLVSPNEMVTDVLKTAGLWKLWTVVDKREEAIYELGAGEVARVEQRERRLLALVSVPCALISVLALSIMYAKRAHAVNAQLAALLLASAALSTGVLSIVKDKGIRRILSLLAVLTSIGVLSSLWSGDNPITFKSVFSEPTSDPTLDPDGPKVPRLITPAPAPVTDQETQEANDSNEPESSTQPTGTNSEETL